MMIKEEQEEGKKKRVAASTPSCLYEVGAVDYRSRKVTEARFGSFLHLICVIIAVLYTVDASKESICLDAILS